ncbi:MAG: hypothetical protein LBN04_08445 [Oscillospiraceae bacterium]|jgi:cell division septum initiation protein DivIVA|nr:hypothetical protein [Oscillospiraceae bacterium]
MEQNVHALLSDLQAMVETAKKVPFTNQRILEKDAVMNLVQRIRDGLPAAISEANRVLKQEARIIQDAKTSYNNSMAEAEAKARALRRESEQRAALLTSESQEKANELVSNAERRANEMLNDAEQKADAMMRQEAVYLRAQQQGESILTAAQMESDRIRESAITHCMEMLKRAEDQAIAVANELRAACQQIDQNR